MCCERWSNEAATVHADIWPDQPDVPAVTIFTFRKGLMSFDLQMCSGRRHSVDRSFDSGSFRALMATLNFYEDLQASFSGFLTCTLQEMGFSRPACGTAVKSVRISTSVCVCVRVSAIFSPGVGHDSASYVATCTLKPVQACYKFTQVLSLTYLRTWSLWSQTTLSVKDAL